MTNKTITVEEQGQKIVVRDNFDKVAIALTDRDGIATCVEIDPVTARELARIINLISIVSESKK